MPVHPLAVEVVVEMHMLEVVLVVQELSSLNGHK
jgi:hypothetical protein